VQGADEPRHAKKRQADLKKSDCEIVDREWIVVIVIVTHIPSSLYRRNSAARKGAAYTTPLLG